MLGPFNITNTKNVRLFGPWSRGACSMNALNKTSMYSRPLTGHMSENITLEVFLL